MRSSTIRVSAMFPTKPLNCEVSAWARAMDIATSSAPNDAPSWNLTSGRRVKRHSLGETFSHPVASCGALASALSRVTRASYIMDRTEIVVWMFWACGSIVPASAWAPMRRVFAADGPAMASAPAAAAAATRAIGWRLVLSLGMGFSPFLSG